jgi:hypothetical protein
MNIDEFTERAATSHYLCVRLCGCSVFFLFCVPNNLIFCAASYIIGIFWYYTNMLPFFVLAIPFKHYVFGFNIYTFVFVSPGLASLYVCFFPHIKQCMPLTFAEVENIEAKNILPNMLKRFEIMPKNIMSVVPLLVQQKKDCWIEFLDTILLIFLIFACNLHVSLALYLGEGGYF